MPVNADFQGFAVDPEQVSANVKFAVATGIAGLSIEDSTGDEADPLYELDMRWSAFGLRDRRSTKAARVWFLPGGLRDSWLDAPTSTRRFEGFARTPKLAPTASTLHGSAPSSMLPRSSPRYHLNR